MESVRLWPVPKIDIPKIVIVYYRYFPVNAVLKKREDRGKDL